MADRKDNTDKNVIVKSLNVRPVKRGSQDIGAWRTALQSAEGMSKNRQRLYDLYSEILLDGHLRAIVDKRIRAITNTTLRYVNADGEEVEDVQGLMESSAFERVLQEIMNAKMWGYSLLETSWQDSEALQTWLVDRRHVKPEMGVVAAEASSTQGLNYNETPYLPYVIRAGQDHDLGLLLQAAQYVIYKRGGISDWAEFAEIFGIPTRIAKYTDPGNKEILEQAFEQMGAAGYMVVPDDTDLETYEGNASARSDIFNEFRKAMNEEMSILILGQTMTTTEASSSGYAQSKVHGDVEEEIHQDDRKFVRRILNTEVQRVLKSYGYGVEGGRFLFAEDDNMQLSDRIEIDLKIARRQPVSDDYFYEKYGIPKPDNYDQLKAEAAASEPAGETNLAAPKPAKKNSWLNLFSREPLDEKLNRLYDTTCPVCGDVHLADDDPPEYINEQTWNEAIRRLHEGTVKATDLDETLLNEIYIALKDGLISIEDTALQAALTENLWTFSGFKTYAELKEASRLLKDSDSNVKPFNKFLDDVRKLHSRYNKHYLHAEYKNAVAQSQMAQRWQQIEQQKDRFVLQYRTAGDSDVRPAHARLDDTTLPADSAFWKSYYPPNGWGCRCTVKQVLRSQATLSNAGQATQEGQKATAGKEEIFRFNAGLEKKVFSDKHPYYDVGKITKNRINKSLKGFKGEQ